LSNSFSKSIDVLLTVVELYPESNNESKADDFDINKSLLAAFALLPWCVVLLLVIDSGDSDGMFHFCASFDGEDILFGERFFQWSAISSKICQIFLLYFVDFLLMRKQFQL